MKSILMIINIVGLLFVLIGVLTGIMVLLESSNKVVAFITALIASGVAIVLVCDAIDSIFGDD